MSKPQRFCRFSMLEPLQQHSLLIAVVSKASDLWQNLFWGPFTFSIMLAMDFLRHHEDIMVGGLIQ